jgi:hypothetical protein
VSQVRILPGAPPTHQRGGGKCRPSGFRQSGAGLLKTRTRHLIDPFRSPHNSSGFERSPTPGQRSQRHPDQNRIQGHQDRDHAALPTNLSATVAAALERQAMRRRCSIQERALAEQTP